MTGRRESVPEAERRRAANAALTGSIEEVCRHYAPSGERVGDCWEVRENEGGVVLRIFLAGPMQGSWTEAATGARGDALDLVAHLRGLDAAGALAEAERFLGRETAEPERGAGNVGGQMALFETLPESGSRKRPAGRSARRRKAGTSRQAATPAPEAGGADSGPTDPVQDAGPGLGEPESPASVPDAIGFTADDRQRIRKTAEDTAWIRSHLTVRSLDARAHDRAKARRDGGGRRWRRAGLKAAGIAALAAAWSVLCVMGEYRYGVMNFASVLGAERPGDARILPNGDGG